MTDKKTLLGMLAVCGACLLTSCSDDDGGSSMPQGPAATYAGKLVAQAGQYKFIYDDNNRCCNIYGDGDYTIDYEEGTISADGEEMRVSFNSSGYITGVSGTWEDDYGNIVHKGSGKVVFAYNGNGELISETSTSSGIDIENGEKSEYTTSYQATHTWKDNNHISSICKSAENEDGEKIEFEDTYTVEYSDIKNVTGQNTFAMTSALDHDLYEPLALIGMFGKGSAYMPSAVKCVSKEFYDGEERTLYDGTDNAQYTMNGDGTVNTERFYGTKNYFYVSAGSGDNSNKAPKKVSATKGTKKGSWVRDFFMRYRARR